MEKSRQTFEQSKYKMQRLNFFVVQQSLEWNTVMQIGRGAAIMGERYGLDMAWLRTSPTLSQSFDSQSSSPTFLSLCSFTVFREIRGEKQLGGMEAFIYLEHWYFFCHFKMASSSGSAGQISCIHPFGQMQIDKQVTVNVVYNYSCVTSFSKLSAVA